MAVISLKKVTVKDKKYFAKWWQDQELIKLTSGILELITDYEIDQSFQSMLESRDDYNYLISCHRKIIGHISLNKRNSGWYETQIVIGEKDFWNQGYGSQAIINLIAKAGKIGIKKIYLEVRPNNHRAIRAYEKAGFQKIRMIRYPNNKHLPETLRMELFHS